MCIAIVMIGKIIVVYVLVTFVQSINAALNELFYWFLSRPKLELFIVMIVIPMTLNIVQFWITDSCLKMDTSDVNYHQVPLIPSDHNDNDIHINIDDDVCDKNIELYSMKGHSKDSINSSEDNSKSGGNRRAASKNTYVAGKRKE